MLIYKIKPPFLFEGISFLKNNDLYDYLIPRIHGIGELRIGEKYYHIVNVQAGMEHGFQKNKDSDIMWDRFVIQLNNGDDIFLYILTSKNSTLVYPESFGIINHSDGTSIRRKLADFYLEQSESWYSQNSKIIYPSSWTLTIPEYHYRLNIIPTMKNQEVDTINTNYWGGAELILRAVTN